MERGESEDGSDLEITFKYDSSIFNKRRINHHDKIKKLAKKFKIQHSFGARSYPSLTQQINQRMAGNFHNSRFSCYASPSVFETGLISDNYITKHMDWALTLEKHEGCVNCINFNSFGDKLASGSDDLQIAIWNWSVEQPTTVFESGHDYNVFQVKFVPNSNDSLLVSCGNDGQVRLCDLNKKGMRPNEEVFTKKLGQHEGSSHKFVIGFGPEQNLDPSIILSCGEDGIVLQFDIRDLKPIKLVQVKNNKGRKLPLYSITQHPFNSYEFAVSGRDSYVRIYDRRKVVKATSSKLDCPVKKYCPHNLANMSTAGGITSVTYNYLGSELLASYAYKSEEIFLFDTTHSDGADCMRRYKGHQNHATIKGVNFYGARSEYVMSGSDCGHIFIWDKDSEEIVTVVKGDETGAVNCVEAHPRFPIIAASGLENSIKILRPFLGETPLDHLEIRRILNKNKKQRCSNRNNDCMGEDDEYGLSFFDVVFSSFVRGMRLRRESRPAAHPSRRAPPNTGGEGPQIETSTEQDVSIYRLLPPQPPLASPSRDLEDGRHPSNQLDQSDDDDEWEDASPSHQSDDTDDDSDQSDGADDDRDQSDGADEDAISNFFEAIFTSPPTPRINETSRRLPNGDEHRPRRYRTSRDAPFVP